MLPADNIEEYHGRVIHDGLNKVGGFLVGFFEILDKFLNPGRGAGGKKPIRHYGTLDVLVGNFYQRIGMPEIGTEDIDVFNIMIGQLGYDLSCFSR